MSNDWQNKLETFFARSKLPKGSRVYLFGSRARGDNHATADIDLGFSGDPNFNITSLDEEIDQLNIPFKIDLVNLDKVSNEFSQKAKSEGIVIFEKRS